MGKTVRAGMADVSGKPSSLREAIAEGWVLLSDKAWRMIRQGEIPKGDVETVATVAGIMGAKATPRILPLCHPIPIGSVKVEISLAEPGKIRVQAGVRTFAPTGVEMEALTAVAAAALCVYDMAKPIDRSIEIAGIRLLRKTGGKSGDYTALSRPIPRRSREASRPASRASASVRGKAPKRSR